MSFDFHNETSARPIPAEIRSLLEGDDDLNSQTSEEQFFSSRILGGFECDYLGWNGHDLLQTTQHVPEGRMAAHYARIKEHGLTAARDGCRGGMTCSRGLQWRRKPVSR